MSARLAAAALCLLLLGSGCGGQSRAKAVSSYIDQVNAIQRELGGPLGSVTQQYGELQSGARLTSEAPKLERSARTIRTLERRLAALDPPAEAVRLDAILRELVNGEWQLAHELALLARYVTGVGTPLARAAAAGERMRSIVGSSKRPDVQAAALDAYAGELDAAVRKLSALRPPRVVAPQHRAQVRTYRRVAGGSRALAAALRRHEGVREELRRLDAAVGTASTLQAQRARRAAVVAFNRRVVRVRKLASAAQRERYRLQQTLG